MEKDVRYEILRKGDPDYVKRVAIGHPDFAVMWMYANDMDGAMTRFSAWRESDSDACFISDTCEDDEFYIRVDRIVDSRNETPVVEGAATQDYIGLITNEATLTKREQFAMAAMQGLLSGRDISIGEAAELSPQYADALIKELDK